MSPSTRDGRLGVLLGGLPAPAGAAIQVFGGIALTWEHPAQLYFKRARSAEILLGAPAYHRDLLAQHLAF